ncbi:hypothetical protein [Burkholderia anthina]|uniref:hypothetical protein n=1 Tax=Burkholderia anthina TaxID=179879 RepID=UPI0037BFD04F
MAARADAPRNRAERNREIEKSRNRDSSVQFHCDERRNGKSVRAIRHVPEHVTAASQTLRYIGVPHIFSIGRFERPGAPARPEIPEKTVLGLQ